MISFIHPSPRKRALLALATVLSAGPLPAATIDTLILGSHDSEDLHAVKADHADIIAGGLGTVARRLLPLEEATWLGGKLTATLKVDPVKQNYVTVRLWGSDVNHNLLMLELDGKQIGYRHLGDYDCLDVGADAPAYNDRFYYKTLPLPLDKTTGRNTAELTIRANGPIWGYGKSFAEYQKPMTEPTRGIYAVYTHDDGCFIPSSLEKQGVFPKDAPLRKEPGEELMAQVKDRVNGELTNLLKPDRMPNQMQTLFLAKAYHTKWTVAAGKPETAAQALRSLDNLYRGYKKNPKLAQEEPSTWNPDWFGLGPSGQVITLLAEPLKAEFDKTIDDGTGTQITRRAAYTEMLLACRDWHRENRRQYTNQSMINDLYGIYLANRGIAVLTPAKALPEKQVQRYLRESIGLEPWLGSEVNGKPVEPLGKDFMQITKKGLTRELGFVGNYGEVIDWVSQIYEATAPAWGKPGDPAIKAQLVRIARARAPFRYPMLDDQGNRTMVQETVVGWRDTHFPGNVTYGQRPSWDGSPFEAAALTLDPNLVGYAQQQIADNQYFSTVAEQAKNKGFRVTFGLLQVPEQYEKIKGQPPSAKRLPMSWDQPDFAFTDEEDGVIAIKHGNEIFYASLYWRARHAVNFLARVHYLTPDFDRVAVVKQSTLYTASGMEYTRPDWTNFGFGNGGHRYPAAIVSAHTGEKLPIAKIPDGIKFKPGDENLYAGRGDLYELRYGPYFVAMNMSKDKTFDVKVPEDGGNAIELVDDRKDVKPGTVCKVAPRTTLVFRFEDKK
ncbi:hypothetical protein [Luteolibacter sp. LG18]|uniref:hypothetical protein n=1 Tax=Luteolibacter sp. LG18 TaxID=2819286 RepID=UPI002B2F1D9C|nr:hypothetical protein llg_44270 [Luteolibacter sp. LG18]